MNKVLYVVCLIGLVSIACKKGQLQEEKYFGKLEVEASVLSTANLDAVFEETKLGTMRAGVGEKISTLLRAGSSGKLRIYKTGETAVLADTLVDIPKNGSKKLKYLYNESLGINGFLGEVNVPADSVQLRFSYADLSNLYPAVDICIWRINGRNYVDDVKIIVRAKKGELSNTLVTLPCKFIAGTNTTYSIKLKDPATGNFISSGTTANWSLINTNDGCRTFSIAAVKISATGTVSITTNRL